MASWAIFSIGGACAGLPLASSLAIGESRPLTCLSKPGYVVDDLCGSCTNAVLLNRFGECRKMRLRPLLLHPCLSDRSDCGYASTSRLKTAKPHRHLHRPEKEIVVLYPAGPATLRGHFEEATRSSAPFAEISPAGVSSAKARH